MSESRTRGAVVALRLPARGRPGRVHRSASRPRRDLHDPWLEPGDPQAWFDRLLAATRAPDRSFAVACAAPTTARSSGVVQPVADLLRAVPQRVPGLLRVRAVRAGRGYMREGLELPADARVRRPGAAPRGGQHPAGERGLPRPGAGRRVPPGGLLAPVPADPGRVARPRALGDHASRTAPRDSPAATPRRPRSEDPRNSDFRPLCAPPDG